MALQPACQSMKRFHSVLSRHMALPRWWQNIIYVTGKRLTTLHTRRCATEMCMGRARIPMERRGGEGASPNAFFYPTPERSTGAAGEKKSMCLGGGEPPRKNTDCGMGRKKFLSSGHGR